jgi:hypothetical protein
LPSFIKKTNTLLASVGMPNAHIGVDM